MAAGGYASHFIGKGHLGWQTEDHLLVNRGFESHVGYVRVQPTRARTDAVAPSLHDVFARHSPPAPASLSPSLYHLAVPFSRDFVFVAAVHCV